MMSDDKMKNLKRRFGHLSRAEILPALDDLRAAATQGSDLDRFLAMAALDELVEFIRRTNPPDTIRGY